MKKIISVCVFLILGLTACSVLGIHYKIHNPKRAGTYPELTEARALLGNQESKYRTCFDVRYYRLTISFGQDLDKDQEISGISMMQADAVADLDTIQIDLAESMQIDKITITEGYGKRDNLQTSEAVYSRKASAVFVKMPHRFSAGQHFALTVIYSGKPPEAKLPPWRGGFVRKKDDQKKDWWGVACQTEGASTWWPCKDVVNDEPDSADLCFTAPENLMVVSNGKLVSRRESEGHRMYTEWHISHPINLYDITFYLGNYKLLHDTYYSEISHDTLQLNHYVLEQHYEKAKLHFKQLQDQLKFYEEEFGPYPFYKDGFKLVESPYAGMEHQSAIAYGNGFKNGPWNFDYIILHETAHEWWGNAVTATDLADAWLHEGFATYSEALYVEKKYGTEAYRNYLLNYRIQIINRRPVVAPYGMRYFNFRDGDIYTKGAWILHSLRYTLNNDSVFFDLLKSFYSRFRYQNAGSADFEKLVNEKTGKNYNWFFDQYLRNRFTPELEYCLAKNQLYYRWTKTNGNFPMTAQVQMAGYIASLVSLPDSTGGIHAVPLRDNSGIGRFNDDQFLYKPVENKKLAKEK